MLLKSMLHIKLDNAALVHSKVESFLSRVGLVRLACLAVCTCILV